MLLCMTMLSFRVPDEDAAEVQRWAEALGVDRSEILRDALHRHLVVLNGEGDAEKWDRHPATEAERSLEHIAEWGPAEDWSDWADAAGEIWFAATPGGDRPVLVLTRDPVADRIGSVVVAALTRTRRGLVSELLLSVEDGVPSDCVVNFDNLHTLSRSTFSRRVTQLSARRVVQACRTLRDALDC